MHDCEDRQTIVLRRVTKIRNVIEHPCLHTELGSTNDDSGYNLAEEHEARRNLHVMAKFQVRREYHGLKHRIISIVLEQRHGEWSTRKTISSYDFGLNERNEKFFKKKW